jgi:hypothetical protein
MSDFDKWWNDLKKHQKRRYHWLPHLKDLAARVKGRPIRYFTLCARSMIDVFMLVREGLLSIDAEDHSIGSVQFCEVEPEDYTAIKELLRREDAGFSVRLERAVLFEDNDFTAECPTLESIETVLEDENVQADSEKVDQLQLKRSFFEVRASFPYDYINLDFCDHYYPEPPGMLRINRTIDRILEWQHRRSGGEDALKIDDFVLAVTCKHDDKFPVEAKTRLANVIKANCNSSPDYQKEVETSRNLTDIHAWARSDREDFFFAGWPKDIANAAKEHGWATDILEYVFYRRVGDSGNPYVIACLVARFTREHPKDKYLLAALHALKKENRLLISDIPRESPTGRELLADMAGNVAVRNEQARRAQQAELPKP